MKEACKAFITGVPRRVQRHFLSWSGNTNTTWWEYQHWEIHFSSGWHFVACRCAAFRKPTLDLSGGQCTLSCVSKGKWMETRQFHWYFTMASPRSRPQHYWKYLNNYKNCVQRHISEIENADNLKRVVQEIWTALSQHYIQSLYAPASIPKRIRNKILEELVSVVYC